MGNILPRPKTDKTNASCTVSRTVGNGRGGRTDTIQCIAAMSSMQGWRVTMEDDHTMAACLSKEDCVNFGDRVHSTTANEKRVVLEELKGWSFWAVYDGHAGSEVAHALGLNNMLINEILNTDYFKSLKYSESENAVRYDTALLEQAIIDAFVETDAKLRSYAVSSGSTVTCALFTDTEIFLINLGDSRVVHVRFCENPIIKDSDEGELTGVEEELEKFHLYECTEDHKPNDSEECERIERAGGMVLNDRVNGMLALSRAIGDFNFKNATNTRATVVGDELTNLADFEDPVSQVNLLPPGEQMVSSIPVITRFLKNQSFESSTGSQINYVNGFTVIACDGIFDVMLNSDVVGFVAYRLALLDSVPTEQDLIAIADEVLEICLVKGSRDNMSLIIVLHEETIERIWKSGKGGLFPKIKEHHALAAKSLDEFLGKLVKMIPADEIQMQYILQKMHDEMETDDNVSHPCSNVFTVPGAGVHGHIQQIREYLEKHNIRTVSGEGQYTLTEQIHEQIHAADQRNGAELEDENRTFSAHSMLDSENQIGE